MCILLVVFLQSKPCPLRRHAASNVEPRQIFSAVLFCVRVLHRGADPLCSQMAGVRASGGGEDSDRGVCQKTPVDLNGKKKKIKNI